MQIFIGPSANPGVEKEIEGSGMRNSVKYLIGLFLGFEGMGLKDI